MAKTSDTEPAAPAEDAASPPTMPPGSMAEAQAALRPILAQLEALFAGITEQSEAMQSFRGDAAYVLLKLREAIERR